MQLVEIGERVKTYVIAAWGFISGFFLAYADDIASIAGAITALLSLVLVLIRIRYELRRGKNAPDA